MKNLVTAGQGAKHIERTYGIRIHGTTIYRWAEQGRIPIAARVGGRTYFELDDIDAQVEIPGKKAAG